MLIQMAILSPVESQILICNSGIIKTIASICLSSSVGRWVDQSPHRLKTLLSTISQNRFAVISASTFWALLFKYDRIFSGILQGEIFGLTTASIGKALLFGIILMLGILENLSASGNMLSMERDWVVAAAAPAGERYDLTQMNASMRRIDLVCKLIAPILISVVVSMTNAFTGVLVVASMSLLSWPVELWCAKRVWSLNHRLREPKLVSRSQSQEATPRFSCSPGGVWVKVVQTLREYVRDLQRYFSAVVWLPSISLAFLHLSALSYGATFITYLLSVGFALELITIARAVGSVVEISSTLVTPVGVKYLGKAVNHGRSNGEVEDIEDPSVGLLESPPDEVARTETGLERLGLWGISWQLLNLVIRLLNSRNIAQKLIVYRFR